MVNDVAIIGAGPAGLAAALALKDAGIRCTIIEREDAVGGLSRTLNYGDFRTDLGPHRFHTKHQAIYDLVKSLAAEDWNPVTRRTSFYVRGKYFLYPPRVRNILRNIGMVRSLGVVFDYFRAQIDKRPPANFKEYSVQKFGNCLAELNILNYTAKIWGTDPENLSVEWAKSRIEGLSMASILKRMTIGTSSAKSLRDIFYYPSHGAGQVYENIFKQTCSFHDYHLNTCVTALERSDSRVTALILTDGKSLPCRAVISSVPPRDFLPLLSAPKEVLGAADSLRFRSQVQLFVKLDKPQVSESHWIYFPDTEIPFSRISEMKNFSRLMAPADKTSLTIEFFCWKNDEIWNCSKEVLWKLAAPWLSKLWEIDESDVLGIEALKLADIYPVYHNGFEDPLSTIEKYYKTLENVYVIGRQGRFRYTNQDQSIEMGLEAAKSLIASKN